MVVDPTLSGIYIYIYEYIYVYVYIYICILIYYVIIYIYIYMYMYNGVSSSSLQFPKVNSPKFHLVGPNPNQRQ